MNMTSPGSGNLKLMQRIEALENENKQLKDANEFSFEERRIGTWIDGKPLYRKMVDFGALPSNEVKKVKIDISDILHAHINLGESMWGPNENDFVSKETVYTVLYNNSINYIQTFLEDGYICIYISTSRDLSKYKFLSCLEYTKTTD